MNFDAPAVLRKWPSLKNQRQFMSKPASLRHMYEIHTAPQGESVSAVLSPEQIVELARLRDFL
jgi:hypothetical protein